MSAEYLAESTIADNHRFKWARRGAIVGLLAGGWGCLIGLGIQAAVDSKPVQSEPPAYAEEHIEEYQAPHRDGLLYIYVTLGSAALGSAVGATRDLLAKKPIQDGSSAEVQSET